MEQGCRAPSAGDHQEAVAGLAPGHAAILEVTAGGIQGAAAVDDPVGAIAALLHTVQVAVERGKLGGRYGQIDRGSQCGGRSRRCNRG